MGPSAEVVGRLHDGSLDLFLSVRGVSEERDAPLTGGNKKGHLVILVHVRLSGALPSVGLGV